MNFSILFFLTVFAVYSVHSYRPEAESNGQEYQTVADEIQDSNGFVADNVRDNQRHDYSRIGDDYDTKAHKKGQISETTVELNENIKTNDKTTPDIEVSADKEYKNLSHKKLNEKKYKKYSNNERYSQSMPMPDNKELEVNPVNDESSNKSNQKRSISSSKQKEPVVSERVERSVNFEPELIDSGRESKKMDKKINKSIQMNDKIHKSMKWERNGKQSKYKKNGFNRRQERSHDYFGFWA